METTIGKRIATLRREKQLKQDDLAQLLDVSPQAVSKWENGLTCPDISLLPKLAKILGVSVDELLSGKQEQQPAVAMVPEGKRKDIKDMILRVIVDSTKGDKVRVNLPMALVQLTMEMGMDMQLISTNDALKDIDWKQIMELVRHDKGMEVNTSGIDRCGGPLPTMDFVRRFHELGGKIITVGSDAHNAQRVGQYSNEMVQQVKEIFGYVCTFENRQPIFHK